MNAVRTEICRIVLALVLIVLWKGMATGTTHVVTFVCCEYTPSSFQAAVGDTVEWQGDFVSHPLQSTTIPSGAPPFGNSSGTSYAYVIPVAGTYDYHCTAHQPSMAGSFTASQDTGLVGTKTIPGDYPTIAAAIADLNANGVGTGGVTFNVAAGHAETFGSLTAGTLTATGTQANQIIFQKSGTGLNPLITAALNGTSTSTDGIVKIVGGDYITFDGIDVQENNGNTTPTTQMEWGYALVKRDSADACRYVTIKNSTITLNKANTSSAGIYSGNHGPESISSITITDTLGTMRYCKFYNNTISNVYWGVKISGSTVATYYDQYNEIGVDGGNTISNYGGSSTAAYGIEAQYQNQLKVANNTVNGGGATHTGALYGIRLGSATNANVDVYNNTITLTQGTTSTSLVYALVNSAGSSGTNNTVNIYNNIVENCTHTNTTSNSVWLIYNLASCYNLNIYGNIVRNNTKSAGTGSVQCIYNSPSSPTVNVQIYNNEVYNNASAGPIHGIHITSGTNTSIFKNNIYDVRSTSTGTGFVTAGITVASGPVNTSIYNNFISDLKAPSAAAVDAVRGINIASTTANSAIGVYYNTVFLNATSIGTNFGTAGVYHLSSATSTTATLDMRNNIVVNLSAPNGTGKSTAFRRSSATLTNYSSLSNTNCFYAGTPSTINVIFFDGTNFDQTLSAYQTRVAPRDSASVSVMPPFMNSSTPPYDLHINPTVSTPVDSGARPVVGIVSDFDGDVRDANRPDIGADEFAFSTLPLPTAPQLVLPGDNAVVNADSVLCVWIRSTPGVTTYWFERATDSLFTAPVIDSTLVDTTNVTRGLVNSTTYWWRVKAKNASGWGPYSSSRKFVVVISGITEDEGITEFALGQNYPNPFNPTTAIAFSIAVQADVLIRVLNVLGQEVRTLVSGQYSPGHYETMWDGRNVSGHTVGSGVYFYRIEARPVAGGAAFVQVKKMLMMK